MTWISIPENTVAAPFRKCAGHVARAGISRVWRSRLTQSPNYHPLAKEGPSGKFLSRPQAGEESWNEIVVLWSDHDRSILAEVLDLTDSDAAGAGASSCGICGVSRCAGSRQTGIIGALKSPLDHEMMVATADVWRDEIEA